MVIRPHDFHLLLSALPLLIVVPSEHPLFRLPILSPQRRIPSRMPTNLNGKSSDSELLLGSGTILLLQTEVGNTTPQWPSRSQSVSNLGYSCDGALVVTAPLAVCLAAWNLIILHDIVVCCCIQERGCHP
jgi:hypothetical protein